MGTRFTPALLALLVSVGACSVDPEEGNHQPHAGEDYGETSQALKKACPPANGVKGIDIASYQHPNGASITWSKVTGDGKKFVIIKATEGTGYTNKYFADDLAKARAAGMHAGAYHFLTYSQGGVAQADHFLAALGTVKDGDMPPMLDVEDVNTEGSLSKAAKVKIMKDWLDHVEQKTGRKPLIYSGNWYWGGHLGSPSGFGAYPVAWADYSTDCPSVPDDFTHVVIHQYKGGGGKTAGISGDCDQDVFYGTAADLGTFTGGQGPEYEGASLGLSGQSYPISSQGEAVVHVGETVKGWVELKNTGSATWKPGKVFLAPIPRDKATPFQAPSWTSDHRISTVQKDTPPGATGHFELDLTGHTVGESLLSLGWVAEGVTWFADAPKGGGPEDGYFAVKVKVEAALPGSGGAGGAGGSGAAGAGGKEAGGAAGKGQAGAAGKGGGSGGKAGAAGAAGEGGEGGESGASGNGQSGSPGQAGQAGHAGAAGAAGHAGDTGTAGHAGSAAGHAGQGGGGSAGSAGAAGEGEEPQVNVVADDTSSDGGCSVSAGSLADAGGARGGWLGVSLALGLAGLRRGRRRAA